jgi:hypothetical protein
MERIARVIRMSSMHGKHRKCDKHRQQADGATEISVCLSAAQRG